MHAKNLIHALTNASENSKIVFFKDLQNLKLSFEDIHLLDYFIPITIKKEKLRENTLSDIESEVIYFFCKSEEIRNKLKTFKFSKELKNTGIKVSVSVNEDKRSIESLKYRLLINKIKEQSEEINNLKNEISSIKNPPIK